MSMDALGWNNHRRLMQVAEGEIAIAGLSSAFPPGVLTVETTASSDGFGSM
jgi:hypothetical protein